MTVKRCLSVLMGGNNFLFFLSILLEKRRKNAKRERGRERKRERRTDRKTKIQRDRQTKRQTDRYTNWHTESEKGRKVR